MGWGEERERYVLLEHGTCQFMMTLPGQGGLLSKGTKQDGKTVAESKLSCLIIRHPPWSLLFKSILLEASSSSLLPRVLWNNRAVSQRFTTKDTIISKITALAVVF